MSATSSSPSLSGLPPELRRQIFLEVAASRPWANSLLRALRPSHKDSSLYSEAIQAYYDTRRCIISRSNIELVNELSPRTKELIRFLHIEFSIHQTSLPPSRFQSIFRYETDIGGKMISHSNSYAPIQHLRILPRPTFDTIAAFSNIRFLHLNAAAAGEDRFHQIEGIARKAVQMCMGLERVEVISDVASVAWRDMKGVRPAEEEENCWWVARLNRGMRVRGKLMAVDSSGLWWPWFWQSPERETLTWTEEPRLAIER